MEAERCSVWILLGRVRAQRYHFSGPKQCKPFCFVLVRSCRRKQAGRRLYICLTCVEALLSLRKDAWQQTPHFRNQLLLHTVHTGRKHKSAHSSNPKQSSIKFCFWFNINFPVTFCKHWPIFGSWIWNCSLKIQWTALFFLNREWPGLTAVLRRGDNYSKALFFTKPQGWNSKQTVTGGTAQLLTVQLYNHMLKSIS